MQRRRRLEAFYESGGRETLRTGRIGAFSKRQLPRSASWTNQDIDGSRSLFSPQTRASASGFGRPKLAFFSSAFWR